MALVKSSVQKRITQEPRQKFVVASLGQSETQQYSMRLTPNSVSIISITHFEKALRHFAVFRHLGVLIQTEGLWLHRCG